MKTIKMSVSNDSSLLNCFECTHITFLVIFIALGFFVLVRHSQPKVLVFTYQPFELNAMILDESCTNDAVDE